MRPANKEAAAGCLFLAAGVTYGAITIVQLPLGTWLEMGPGFFPLLLCGSLVVLGLVMIISGFRRTPPGTSGRVPWRGIILISAATIFFAAFIDRVGLFAGVLVTALLSCAASGETSVRAALLTSLVLALFATVVFHYGMGLAIPIIGPLFTF